MPYKDPRKKQEWQRRRDLQFQHMRREGIGVARFILREARRSDRLRHFNCDLTREQIESLISQGCSYCGEKDLRMTLDRIDNARGHVADHVVPACIRCNYARRDRPYEAWLCLVSGLRRAREWGLFNGWTGRTR